MKATKTTGNVFADLGFGKEEAANLLIRSKLMVEIKKFIEKENLTQAKAAKGFGVTQPRISDLVRGKIELFTVDTLIEMLSHVGIKVDVKLTRKRKTARMIECRL